ncbi:hypothetical protein GCM10010329_82940 [Streptomyces spiroverticillatus]|uniref:Uncharacterized protein n=1 Tax=Streptomyces finlayi TaxID=67296 RepID=A0A919CFP5_9ACTN|nr:hypothetical protein [Streptomyces finlayi]GHA47926.1 hypothetical protein GCM10010329_82940 [Streptomyces spiroverticillatus]GHD18818.1 hypothetical protein GCM10010334_82000 [Streptomyces finlayi]
MKRRPSSPRARRTRSPLALLAAGLALVLLGVALLYEPEPSTPEQPPVTRSARTAPQRPLHTADRTLVRAPQPEPTRSLVTGPGELPAPGEGPRADPAIQRVLRAAVPDDLPAPVARQVEALGRAVLVADVTGRGRPLWPAYFPPGQPVRAFTRMRVQATAAQADGTNRAVVHLVWAGADPGGTYRDGRPHTLRFQHTNKPTLQGVPWTPVP